MRVFISSDIEGTAGIVHWEQVLGGPEYEAGRTLLDWLSRKPRFARHATNGS